MKKTLSFILFMLLLFSGNTQQTDSLFIANTVPYQWVSYRMKINFIQKGEKRQFQALFVNRIDSIMYINLNISGIELARMVLTPERVTFVDKINYEYYDGDYSFMSEKSGFPLNFHIIQSLMNGIDLPYPHGEFHRLIETGDTLLYVFPKRCIDSTSCIHQELHIKNHTLFHNNIWSENGVFLQVDYNQHSIIEEKPFFLLLQLKIPQSFLEADMELKSIKFNVPGTTSIKIPDKFKPM
jgi:hypothetical protein